MHERVPYKTPQMARPSSRGPTTSKYDMADTLEFKTEKENAHSSAISSVDYSPDGKTIVSACYGGTLKVWAAGMKRPLVLPNMTGGNTHLKTIWQTLSS